MSYARRVMKSGRLMKDKNGNKRYHSYSYTLSMPRLFCDMAELSHKDTVVATILDSDNGPMLLIKKLNIDRLKELDEIGLKIDELEEKGGLIKR